MTGQPFKSATPLLASALVVFAGGCSHFPMLAKLFNRPAPAKIVPVQANLQAPGPFAAEDRLYASAVKAIDKRNYGEALDLLQVARDARPQDPRVLTAMGVVYDKLGRFDLSDRYYDQAEKADPGSRIVAMDRRYSVFLRSGGKIGLDGAALAQNAATKVQAKSATAGARATQSVSDRLYADAVKAIGSHEYGVALGDLREAKDAAPNDARVLTALGVTYDHLGRFDLSARYYDLAEKADPGSVVVAQDRHTSLMLQQHGGFSGPDDIIVLAGATPAKAAAKPPVRVAKAAPPKMPGDHG